LYRSAVDPITLIVTALVAGASAAAQETAGTAVKDAYAGLKALIRRRFGREDAPELDDPAAAEAPLTEKLRAAGAERDEELVRAAQALLAQVDPENARAGRYNVQISGGKGIVVGDSATVTMNFDGD
jgi:hypothetical protein